MDCKAFSGLVQDGVHPVVEFGPGVVALEDYLDPGMRGKIVGVKVLPDDVVAFNVDINGFEEFNAPFEIANYNGRGGATGLTAREAGQYPKDGKLEIFLSLDDPQAEGFSFDQILKVVDAERLFLYNEFQKADAGISYTAWLEERVLGTRQV